MPSVSHVSRSKVVQKGGVLESTSPGPPRFRRDDSTAPVPNRRPVPVAVNTGTTATRTKHIRRYVDQFRCHRVGPSWSAHPDPNMTTSGGGGLLALPGVVSLGSAVPTFTFGGPVASPSISGDGDEHTKKSHMAPEMIHSHMAHESVWVRRTVRPAFAICGSMRYCDDFK